MLFFTFSINTSQCNLAMPENKSQKCLKGKRGGFILEILGKVT